jgi:CubicO group peptidase (beta-lactamase class C family)
MKIKSYQNVILIKNFYRFINYFTIFAAFKIILFQYILPIMKIVIYRLLFSFLVISLFSCNISLSLHEQADNKMKKIVNDLNAVGLSVAVVKDNDLVYTNSFGFKDLSDSTLLTDDNIFRIASVSKSFTATAVMQLIERGKFNLDDDISDALGISVRNPTFPDIPITYRMLLNHTSSLNDTTGYFTFNVIDNSVNSEYWRAYNSYAPGTKYQYCNLGFNILGALGEIHSGKRFDRYIRRNISAPLGIIACFNTDSFDPTNFVTLYNFTNGIPTASSGAYTNRLADLERYTLGRTTPIFSPTGGMKSNPKHVAIHMLAQMNGGTYNGGQVLQAASVTAMQMPSVQTTEIGRRYGFAIETVTNLIEGETLKGHTGSAYGLYSAMYFCPEKKFGFVMMTNGYPANRAENGFLTIQTEVINALYDIFIKN